MFANPVAPEWIIYKDPMQHIRDILKSFNNFATPSIWKLHLAMLWFCIFVQPWIAGCDATACDTLSEQHPMITCRNRPWAKLTWLLVCQQVMWLNLSAKNRRRQEGKWEKRGSLWVRKHGSWQTSVNHLKSKDTAGSHTNVLSRMDNLTQSEKIRTKHPSLQ